MNSAYEEIAAAWEEHAAADSRLAAAFRKLAETVANSETPAKKATPKPKTKETPRAREETQPSGGGKPPATFEDVRAVLAQKSVDGYTGEVRALIERYGAKKLSDLGSECYEPLLLEAEGIGNGK